ncbi:MAG TPA: peptide deformylase, partial [Candidatus Xenobia bacterium]
MPLPIVFAGDPVLRQVARPLPPDELRSPRIQNLIGAMQETMRQAPGVGLAAPQIGESIQLVVIEDRAECPPDLPQARWDELERSHVPFHVLVNPVIISCSPDLAAFYEGCLSVPGYRCVVPRARRVEVSACNEKGDPVRIHGRGWYARIL